jgi:hypothetical protein
MRSGGIAGPRSVSVSVRLSTVSLVPVAAKGASVPVHIGPEGDIGLFRFDFGLFLGPIPDFPQTHCPSYPVGPSHESCLFPMLSGPSPVAFHLVKDCGLNVDTLGPGNIQEPDECIG